MNQEDNQENNNNLDGNNNTDNNNNNDDQVNNERNIEIDDNNNQSNNDRNNENNDDNSQNNLNDDNNNQVTQGQGQNNYNNNQNENQNSTENQNKEEEEKKSKISNENNINNNKDKNSNINKENKNNNNNINVKQETENSPENESLLKNKINNEKTDKNLNENSFSNKSDQNATNVPIQDSSKKIKVKSTITHEYTINSSIRRFPFIFYFYIFLIFLNIILIYIIKPFSTIFYFIFFERFNNTLKDEREKDSKKKIKKVFIVFGYLIIFLLPTFHFFTRGIYILVHHKGCLYKIYIFIILCIEIYFNLPLTFLYEENYYSIFYFRQQGIEILLNPTLIFFPTDYILSYFEIIRNIIESVYFFILTVVLYDRIKDNIYQQFTLNFMIVTMILYIYKFLGAIAMLVIKIIFGDSNSDKRPLKVKHKIWLEFEDQSRREKKKKIN